MIRKLTNFINLFFSIYSKGKFLLRPKISFNIIIIIIFINILLYFIYIDKLRKNLLIVNSEKNANFKNFDYSHHENNTITKKMINKNGWMLSLDQVFFINGLIRKYKPKNCLEIGVAYGGSSAVILNAIKDYPGSQLISIDLYTKKNNKSIGYLIKENYPELAQKWKLFTGDMPHKFLSKLNLKFDFVFLDSAHVSPGEFFNLIETLPFLNENAIIVLHDIIWHFYKSLVINKKIYDIKVMPTQIYLMSSLIGEKILIKRNKNDFSNIGAIYLSTNQRRYYLNYFLLIMNIGQYLPSNEQLNIV